MKRLSSVAVHQTIAILIVVGASVFPLYGQEVTNSDQRQAAHDGTLARSSGMARSTADNNAQPVSAQSTSSKTAPQPFVFPTKRERFNRYVKSTVGPSSLVGSAITAGIDQWRDHPDEWEQGAKGYGKRYASDFARNGIQQTVVYGLDSALGLDTKFRRSTRKGIFPRMVDALAENVTSRNKSGGRVISVPRISGIYTAQIIKYEAWFPERYSYKDGLRGGTRSLAAGFAINLLREFVIRF
ncbi:MAG TPA: hypothetical protein VNO50_03080 [Pyrinomonadaceae bacterium]|nr:hypothetical protein [Pyrinomonadaceae bacterium]